ncbi:hypothetical protein [Thalassomonas haliotis]|uniref:Uncharacterized protein n=1 Tax=Thalassomonas haliotis TaxID=485448 RepID=A0ABY7VIK4_9GAMM|nr:hypothetical protein [Thalassomonas haliotis]WDE13565.1 hypothetical protein H3N35_09090 [Thalassomonas haliotis]
MQITGTNQVASIYMAPKSGNILPSGGETQPVKESSRLHDLAKDIEPTNMSRNEARAIASALLKSGDGELANTFAMQSMILKVNPDGSVENAMPDDAIMNEKFNMFDSLKGQMEFNRSRNISTKSLEAAEAFLSKLQVAKTAQPIDYYA